MSSLFPQNSSFSPARTASPHIRTNPDVDSQYLAELLAEHQKLEPFVQVVPICSRLLNQEILRVSGMMSNHGFNDYERLQRGSPNLMASQDIKPNLGGTGIGGWSGHPHEDLITRKRIGSGREEHGLYILDQIDKLAHSSIQLPPTKEDIWLWHRCLGHPSFFT